MKRNRKSYIERAELCHSLITKKLFHLMEMKQTNLALSADVNTARELLTVADVLGPEICVLKTHIDIIDDFTPALLNDLQALASKYDFLIFEDRKFADIGNTVKLQYAGGIYRIADWAHLINAHTLPGPGVIAGLKEAANNRERGLLLLAEMSSAGNLLDENYVKHTLSLAENFPEFVIGFIAQHKISPDDSWITMTPGIELSACQDHLSQQYMTPQTAILERGSDIIIVGRGILKSENILFAAKTYRAAGWNAYLQAVSTSCLT